MISIINAEWEASLINPEYDPRKNKTGGIKRFPSNARDYIRGLLSREKSLRKGLSVNDLGTEARNLFRVPTVHCMQNPSVTFESPDSVTGRSLSSVNSNASVLVERPTLPAKQPSYSDKVVDTDTDKEVDDMGLGNRFALKTLLATASNSTIPPISSIEQKSSSVFAHPANLNSRAIQTLGLDIHDPLQAELMQNIQPRVLKREPVELPGSSISEKIMSGNTTQLTTKIKKPSLTRTHTAQTAPQINGGYKSIYIPTHVIQDYFSKQGIRSLDDNRLKPIIEKLKSGQIEVIRFADGTFKITAKHPQNLDFSKSQIMKSRVPRAIMDGLQSHEVDLKGAQDFKPEFKDAQRGKAKLHRKVKSQKTTCKLSELPVEERRKALAKRASHVKNGLKERGFTENEISERLESTRKRLIKPRPQSISSSVDYSGSGWGSDSDFDTISNSSSSKRTISTPPSLISDTGSIISSQDQHDLPIPVKKGTFPVYGQKPSSFRSAGILNTVSSVFGYAKNAYWESKKPKQSETPFSIERFLKEDSTAYDPYAAFPKLVNP